MARKIKMVVINGVAQHGKDTFVKYVSEKAPFLVVNHSTVKTVKVAARLFGANEKVHKGDAERRLWSDLKDAWTRYCDGPFKEILEIVDGIKLATLKSDKVLVFVHAREPLEIHKLKTHFGLNCTTVLVCNSNKEHTPDNHADQDVFAYDYDVYIKNDGTLDELKAKAEQFITTLF